jgi:RNA polymerase sigma-70 factor (ECF subfamily)
MTARFDQARTLTERVSVHAFESSADDAMAAAQARPRALVRDQELFALVYRSMRTLVPPQDNDFDDLVQAAATDVWRTLDRFEGKSELSTWVYGVCYRVLLNHRRFWRRFRLRFEMGLTTDPSHDAPQAFELLDQRERAARLRGLLGRLSDKYRAVVVLYDLEGLSVAEISGIVGANELTVRSRLRDGRRQLRRLVEREPGLTLEEG